MSQIRTVAATVLLGVVAVAPLLAQEQPVKTRSFSADFGFVSAAGNTNVKTLNFGDRLVLNTADKKLIFTQTFNAVRSEADGNRTAENYRTQVRLDRGLGHRFYLFLLGGWERNVPAGVARRFEETLGLAYRAIETEQDQLNIEIGLSFFQQRNLEATQGQSLDDTYTAGRAAASYKRVIRAPAFVSQHVEFIPNFDDHNDFRINTETALVAPLSTAIGVKLGYVIRYDNVPGLLPDPNPTLERLRKTDRFLTAGLTISY
ncbi:MAG: DUF481 domain-containing protein [Gemmatimonadales bacterium]|nr:DUF481 domain-containing protein [Gemmatimonadales bacterium]